MTDASSTPSSRHRDAAAATVFVLLTAALVGTMARSPAVLEWAFQRHHNVLSWYVRPLFLVPFCLFARRRSLAGMSATLFLLATSMFWFPRPAQVDPKVSEFLDMEPAYLMQDWTPATVLLTLLVPATLAALAAALWRHDLRLGLVVLVLIAVLKMAWGVLAAGTAGTSVIAPALLLGLAVCAALLRWSLRRNDGRPGRRARGPPP